MKTTFAKTADALVLHDLLFQTFLQYKNELPPSSALQEAV